jgi:hypothetical protein
LNAELAALRARNDHEQSEIDTATLRGEIKRIKSLLALQPSE